MKSIDVSPSVFPDNEASASPSLFESNVYWAYSSDQSPPLTYFLPIDVSNEPSVYVVSFKSASNASFVIVVSAFALNENTRPNAVALSKTFFFILFILLPHKILYKISVLHNFGKLYDSSLNIKERLCWMSDICVYVFSFEIIKYAEIIEI